jgi:serine/threonine protein kinase
VKTTIKTCTYCNSAYDTTATHICLNAHAVETADMPQPNIGMIIDKKYRLENKLGEGGMGSVFRARRLFIDDFVAVKFVRPEVLTNPEFRERFYQEARVAARIKHSNVVTVYDFGETPDGMLYLVMEFLEGLSLGELLKKKGAFDLDHVVDIGLQIGEALYCMHENNVIHRDLKPDNIMLIQDGKGGETVKVVDFGVAKILEANPRLTRYQARIGSPVYCSPEQYLGQPVDHRTDLYGLGIIFYECLSGRVPFDSLDETELRAAILHKMPARLDKVTHVTSDMADLVQWLLAKDPNDRPHNVAEINKCLHALRRGQKSPPEKNASPSANGVAAKARLIEQDKIAVDEAILFPILEKEEAVSRQRPVLKKNESASSQKTKAQQARQAIAERQKNKLRKRRIPRVAFVSAFVFLVSLLIWKTSLGRFVPAFFPETLEGLTTQIKKWAGEEKNGRKNQLAIATSKSLPAASQQVSSITMPVVTAKTSAQSSASSLANGVSEKSDANRNSQAESSSALKVSPTTGVSRIASAKNNIETPRNAFDRRDTKKGNSLLGERRSRVTPTTKREKRPAAQKNLPLIPAGMVLVKGMEFKRGDLFGDGNSNEKPAHLVRVNDFLIGQHEVTNREYLEFVKATGGNFPEWINPNSKYHYQTGSDPFYKKLGPALYQLDHPVVGVSWQDAIMYCAWLALKGAYKYRLPTEAEWELAGRGGNNAIKYSWGNGAPLLALGGNVGDEALKNVFPDWPIIWRAYNDNYAFTAPVGKFGANVLGVFDMTGNVSEWCSDWYEGSYYQKQEWDRPAGPLRGTEKVIRGGSWSDTPAKLRIAYRRSAPPTFRSNNLGFRVAASAP